MKPEGVFCDTSFFIRLLDKTDSLHQNAKGYFKYLSEREHTMFISTISIAEDCVGGEEDELPLRNLRVVPFNFDHGKRAGEFSRELYRKNDSLSLLDRKIISNDLKLFAQADVIPMVKYLLSGDRESKNIFKLLQEQFQVNLRFIHLSTPYNETFGVLGLE